MLTTRYNHNLPLYVFIGTISSFLISLFVFQVFAVLLILLWIFEKNKNKLKPLDTISYLFITFVLIRIISALFSSYPELSNQMFYKDAIFILGFFAFNYYLKVFDENKIKNIAFVLIIAAAVVAVLGIGRFVSGSVHRAESFTSGYMAFSLYLLGTFSFGMMLYSLLKTFKQNILYSSAILLILGGIVTSLGRTNIIVAAVVFFIGIFLAQVNRLYALIVVVLTVLLCWAAFNLNTEELIKRIDTPATMSDRDILLQDAKEIFLKFEKPFLGYGPRTFNEVFSKKELLDDKGVASWHDDYIQLYMESGFLGLISYLFLIGFTLLKAIQYLRRKPPAEEKVFVIGSVMAIIALMIAALTSGFINSPQIAVLLAFFIALISSIVYPVKQKK